MEKARVLIVEDETIIAMGIESNLQGLGYEVTSIVNNGTGAIKKAETDKPDLILMDIRIKGEMDGIEAAEVIRNQFGIPVIFSTAYLDQGRIERAKITMPFGYVLKPIQERDLKVTLEMALYVAKVDAERKKAELEVVSQVDFLDSVMAQSPFAMWIADTRGIVIKTNRTLREMLNLTDQQIVGRYNVLKDVNLEQQGVMPQVRSVFTLKKKATFTIPWTGSKAGDVDFKSARDLWIDVTIFPIVDKKGDLLNVVCQWIDTSEHKQMEDTLVKQEKTHIEMLEGLNDAAYRMSLPDGKYEYFSQASKGVFGYDPEEWKNNPLLIREIVHPEFVEYFKEKWADLIDGKVPKTYEYKIIDPEGNERWIFQSNTAIYDEDTNIIAIEGLCRDITESKQVMARLKKSEKRFHDLVMCSTDWIWEIDERGEFTYVSEKIKPILGYDPEEIIGKTPFDLMPKKEAERVEIIFKEILSEKKRIVDLENWNLTKDGSKVCLLTNGIPILDDEGNYSGYRGVNKDISVLKKPE